MNYMIDTIGMFFRKENGGLPPKVVRELEYKMIGGSRQKSEMFKNFQTFYNHRGTVLIGSLNTYEYGNNFSIRTYEELVNAILHLSNEIGLPPESIPLSSVDFFTHLTVEESVASYLKYFGAYSPKWKKEFPSGIIYSVEEFSIKIYDKIREMLKKDKFPKDFTPDLLNKNIMRIEIRLRKLKNWKQRGIVIENLSDLMKDEVINSLLNLLKSSFCEIDKKTVLKIPNSQHTIFNNNISTQKMLFALCFSSEQIREFFLSTLNLSYHKGEISYPKLWRWKKNIRESKKIILEEYIINPLKELEDKVVSIEPLVRKTQTTEQQLYYF